MGAINGKQSGRWLKKKPKANKECLLLVASSFGGKWNYKIFIVKKIYLEHNYWYWGLCHIDGDEWGGYSELTADLYCIIKSLKGK